LLQYFELAEPRTLNIETSCEASVLCNTAILLISMYLQLV